MSKTFNEEYTLIEEKATNNFQYPLERDNPKKVAAIFEFDA